ncbi:MAG: RidA family protein [Chloroflexales bacterium]|nr:RidA family protein [Chloroflexales bacterium]
MRYGSYIPVGCRTRHNGQVQHLNPEGLSRNPPFTQVVTVSGPVKTVYVGGQNSVEASGAGDIAAQSAQVFRNLQTALAAAGARIEHVIQWKIYIVQGQPLEPGFAEFQKVWGRRPNPPTITGIYVAALANPAFLVELEAIPVVPAE